MEQPEADARDGAVESLFGDYLGLVTDLSDRSPSGLAALNRSFHKVILIAAASNLEAVVKRLIKQIFETQGATELGLFVENAVLVRGYHTLFDWKAEKASGFFKSFGDDCMARYRQHIRDDNDFKEQHDAFMRLGSLRNQLVHQDYASFTLEVTPEELITLYRHAIQFPERFESLIFEQR